MSDDDRARLSDERLAAYHAFVDALGGAMPAGAFPAFSTFMRSAISDELAEERAVRASLEAALRELRDYFIRRGLPQQQAIAERALAGASRPAPAPAPVDGTGGAE